MYLKIKLFKSEPHLSAINELIRLLLNNSKLTLWGRVTHICVSKIIIIGSENGLSPGRRQAIIWTNAGILLIEPLGTNFSEILTEVHTFSFKKMHLEMLSAKWRLFGLGFNELIWSLLEKNGSVMRRFDCTYEVVNQSLLQYIPPKVFLN